MPSVALFEKSSKMLAEYIRERGLRNTWERKTILQQICLYKSSFTAEQLITDLEEKEHISVATVYNTLDLFVQCNLLTHFPAQTAGAREEYQLLLLRENKMSFRCTNCGRRVDFKDKAIDDIVRNKHLPNFNIECFTLQIYGTCKTCRKKRSTKK